MFPKDEKEQKIVNYNMNCYLHNLIAVYKGTSDNKFVNYLNTIDRRDEAGNKVKVDSINSVNVDGKMQLAIFFDNNAEEATLYSFESMLVTKWFKGYLENCINKIDWK